jgi:hypothetical protein
MSQTGRHLCRRSVGSDPTVALLEAAWAALGGEMDLLELVDVRGDRAGLLPSRLAAQSAMVAAVAVSTLAASVLDAARRGGPPVRVLVDAEHVAVAARSARYARAEGVEPSDFFAALSRFWRTADGWLRLHANYGWHRERALRVLRCQDAAEAVETPCADGMARSWKAPWQPRAGSATSCASRRSGGRTRRVEP